jgi:protein O-GlcNAc transferase
MQKKNVISYSLWGNGPKYRIGAIKNCELAPIIYPGWHLRFYIDNTIEKDFAKQLHSLGAEVFQVQETKGPFHGMYWRFFVNDDKDIDRYIIRDCDSRLNWRERAAVDDWVISDKDFHIMRDHKNHIFAMQGGMWGGKTGIIPSIQNLIKEWNQYDKYACDQYFLSNVVYSMIKDNVKVHDEYYEHEPFPIHEKIKDGGWFVGQIYNEFNVPQKD